MPHKHVYRAGDRVRVVTPKVFLRCGYPYDIVAEGERIQDAFAEDIVALIDKMDPRGKPTAVREPAFTSFGLLRAVQEPDAPFVPQGFAGFSADYRDLCGRFARIIAQRRGFGGSERRIFTADRPELLGKELIISNKFHRKTGKRYGPSNYQNYEGEWDYDPGGLEGEQTHTILECYPVSTGELISTYDVIRIEAANVEPVAVPAEEDA